MIFARPSTLSAARRICLRTSSKQLPRSMGRRQYASNLDGAAQVVNSSSKLTWIISAGAIAAGGAYYLLQPGTSTSTSQHQHAPSQSQPTNNTNNTDNTNDRDKHEKPQQDKKSKFPRSQLHGPDGYADDKPKPVEERHGPSIEKHGIASEKNQHHVRTGVFSGEKFDNHIQKREDEPAKEFEKVEGGGGSAENGKKGK